MSAEPPQTPTHDFRLRPETAGVVSKTLFAVGLASILVAGIGALAGGGFSRFMFSYLTAFAFVLSLALGGLFFIMIHHITNARWSVVLRRLIEAVSANLPWLALGFVPIVFALPQLYEWARPEVVAHDPLLQEKQIYLNDKFFAVRAVLYFVIWSLLARQFYGRSLRHEDSRDYRHILFLKSLSAPGLLIFALTVTFAAFDWLMSLAPHWYSTIFGVYYFAGAAVAIFATIALMALVLEATGLTGRAITAEHYHDLGKLLFGFIVFWAYIAVSQLLLIWMGNLPEETVWYVHRWQGTWKWFSWGLVIGHFILPFLLLLPRSIKRFRPTLALAAVWMLLMHYMDLFWLVMPTFDDRNVPWHFMDPFLAVGLTALFFGLVVQRLAARPVVAVHDPHLTESMTFENV